MFCVECGNKGPIYKDGVCINCYIKTHSFSVGPKLINLLICSNCNSYKYKNTWTSESMGDVFKRMIKSDFNISKELKKVNINTECKKTNQGMKCMVYITGLIDDVEINEEHELLVRLKNTICDICSKRFGGYHEATVQIRAENRKLTKEEIKNIKLRVENLVENIRANGNRALFITDIGEEHGGINFYISEKGAGRAIAKKIQDHYGGIIKQSSKNIGMKDSRQVHRMTYLLRIPFFKKGDYLIIEDNYFQIISMGNKIKMINLSDWNETIIDIKNLQKITTIKEKEHINEMILINQTEDEVQLMDSNNYNIIILKKPEPISLSSKKIPVLKLEDKIFLSPKLKVC
jgi:nonsense-mediated mRNA decay protein 3